MPINAKNIVVQNEDKAHLRPLEAPKPNKPRFEPPKSTSKPVEHRAQPVHKQTNKDEANDGLFVKKRSKFLDDMTKS